MNRIELDAAKWRGEPDFYQALLAALGAPHWHGWNLNALTDSMIYGDINEIGPPMRIDVRGLDSSGADARSALTLAFQVLGEVGATFEIKGDTAFLQIARAG